MTKQDRQILNELLKEYTPKYSKGQIIRYNKKTYTITNISIGFSRFGSIELQYNLAYTYTNYRHEIIDKSTSESAKLIDLNGKLKEVIKCIQKLKKQLIQKITL
jgi:hypothetical protein